MNSIEIIFVILLAFVIQFAFVIFLRETVYKCEIQNRKLQPEYYWFLLLPFVDIIFNFIAVYSVEKTISTELKMRSKSKTQFCFIVGILMSILYATVILLLYLDYSRLEEINNIKPTSYYNNNAVSKTSIDNLTYAIYLFSFLFIIVKITYTYLMISLSNLLGPRVLKILNSPLDFKKYYKIIASLFVGIFLYFVFDSIVEFGLAGLQRLFIEGRYGTTLSLIVLWLTFFIGIIILVLNVKKTNIPVNKKSIIILTLGVIYVILGRINGNDLMNQYPKYHYYEFCGPYLEESGSHFIALITILICAIYTIYGGYSQKAVVTGTIGFILFFFIIRNESNGIYHIAGSPLNAIFEYIKTARHSDSASNDGYYYYLGMYGFTFISSILCCFLWIKKYRKNKFGWIILSSWLLAQCFNTIFPFFAKIKVFLTSTDHGIETNKSFMLLSTRLFLFHLVYKYGIFLLISFSVVSLLSTRRIENQVKISDDSIINE